MPLTTVSKGSPQTAESASTAIKKDSMEFFRQPASHSNAVVEIDDPSQPSWSGGTDDARENQATTNNDDDTSSCNAANGNCESANATESQVKAKTATLLTYPYGESGEQKNAGKISITYGDIARLAPGEFLNDSIIDFYLRFLWRHLESWQKECVYIYSSHFFTQLSGSGALTPDERFARVSRWTLKESDLFEKRFLFIPINDSVAVFCNPGSAIIQKRRRLQQVVMLQNGDVSTCRRIALENGEPIIVDLVDNFNYFRRENGQDQGETVRPPPQQNESVEVKEEYVEEELELTQQNRQQHPPCLLFLDSLRCHRKKKFTAMLREYLDCEWKSRLSGHESVEQKTAESIVPSGIDDESIVTYFDADSITLLEPEIPLQTNSSDCGVFLLMYAAEVLRRFPAGITREDVETNFSATLTSEMFDGEHVLEFRDYLHQLIFCLQSLQKRGLSENHVQDEELDTFTIDR
uniref:Ubiquitin-like protease family profile domain-containing protein n=1 Tax=Globisporangium ultimum (strain ATCC 200006 / CBS 805.95 / DAOM BR144) TaxID=431595 RepID=K3WDC5_GLOUD